MHLNGAFVLQYPSGLTGLIFICIQFLRKTLKFALKSYEKLDYDI